MSRLLTPKQMSQTEAASEQRGTSLWTLMLNAGNELAAVIKNRAEEFTAKRILMLCGKGNNGGDGFVAAAKIKGGKTDIKVKLMCGEPESELAKRACALLSKEDFIDDAAGYAPDMIVDCIFGTGFHGEFDKELADALYEISLIKAYRIACDMPSGVNCCNGKAAAETLICDETVTFHSAKLGMAMRPAKLFCGRVVTADIGIPDGWAADIDDDTVINSVDCEYMHKRMPRRSDISHKGSYGRLLMICGSEGYPGAAAIASRAALHSGCGIVQLCTPRFVVKCIASTAPECVYTPLPVDENGCISEKAIPQLLRLSENSDAVLIGCGIGKTVGTAKIVEEFVKNCKTTLVIDADGINVLAEHIDILREKSCDVILTPHVAELARLCKVEIAEASERRYRHARELSREYGIVVHAKDTTSITVDGKKAFVTDFGNSALAKGGSGDMLAGLIGSMLAQGVKPRNACMLADYIMGRTAEMLCEKYSPMAVTSSDIIAAFKETLTAL